jgi:plastocyanin
MKRLIVAAAILSALAAVGQAVAANTYTVFLGEQGPAPAGTPKGSTLDSFFPGKVTIVSGDKITFSSATFHTASYGFAQPALIMGDPAKGKYSGIVDSTKTPFYFNGLPKLIYNGQAFGPFGSTTITSTAPVSSGALSPSGNSAHPKPATATFTFQRAGVYQFFCAVHPGMKGTIVVKPAGGAAPMTPTQVQAEALQQVSAGWAAAKAAAAAAKPPANTVDVGVGNASTLLAYFPATLNVKAGTTVNFVNRAPREVHNLVFGPKKYIEQLQKQTDLFPTGPKSPNQVAPFLPYGSEPKGQYTYTGTNHGNGFFATPLTVGPSPVPLPKAWRVTFNTPGTYKYFCWIHGPDMAGTIVVTK